MVYSCTTSKNIVPLKCNKSIVSIFTQNYIVTITP